jgi:hypothetical protein
VGILSWSGSYLSIAEVCQTKASGKQLKISDSKARHTFVCSSEGVASNLKAKIERCQKLWNLPNCVCLFGCCAKETAPLMSLSLVNGMVWSMDAQSVLREWKIVPDYTGVAFGVREIEMVRKLDLGHIVRDIPTPDPGKMWSVGEEVFCSFGGCWVRVHNSPLGGDLEGGEIVSLPGVEGGGVAGVEE